MSDKPSTSTPVQPSGPSIKKIENAEKLPIKQEKIEGPEKLAIKQEKVEKIELKEKPEKHEHKEKPEKIEHKEKPEKFEHKEKPEKHEHKEKPEKIEHKENLKIEQIEKNFEFPRDPGGPVEQRLATLEQGMTSMQHFITTGERPDISRGALAAEPDKTNQ